MTKLRLCWPGCHLCSKVFTTGPPVPYSNAAAKPVKRLILTHSHLPRFFSNRKWQTADSSCFVVSNICAQTYCYFFTLHNCHFSFFLYAFNCLQRWTFFCAASWYFVTYKPSYDLLKHLMFEQQPAPLQLIDVCYSKCMCHYFCLCSHRSRQNMVLRRNCSTFTNISRRCDCSFFEMHRFSSTNEKL